MSVVTPPTTRRKEWLMPFLLAVPFTTIITGLFNLSEFLPLPVALIIGAGWGVLLGLIATWIRKRRLLSAWRKRPEDRLRPGPERAVERPAPRR